ncbi:MAG: LLM class F420-dependent oxidoreductase [Pseudomonadales bacterium]|nr:LLM class F420-dependent oxidoreductase [Chloroflexota bacterium]MCH2578669.1 LLM class F420-dependent oxidoreductase [Pseudomonadales bacterium]
MDIGASFPTTSIGHDSGAVREFVQAVEDLGYSHIRILDHVVGANPEKHPEVPEFHYTHESVIREPFTLMAYIAGFTSKIDLVTGIIILPQRQTVLVAKQAAEVDVLSGGRLRLGIGVGWNPVEFTALGEDFGNRGRRIEEQVEVLRLLWTNNPIEFHGQWHHIESAGINPLPIQRPIPIWMGAGGPGMPVGPNRVLRRVGRLADGYFPLCEAGDTARTLIETVKRYAQEAGRNPDDLKIEGRIELTGTPEDWKTQLIAWEDLGADLVSIGTARAPFHTPHEHIQAIKTFKEII